MKAHYRRPKKQLPFKSRSHTWHAASGSNDNLVISFSEDDSDSEHEDSRPEVHDKKHDDAVTTDWLQRSTSTTNVRTNLSQKSLNNKSRDPHGRLSVNSLVSANQKVTASITRSKRASQENEALLKKCDPGKSQLSGLSWNSVDNFQQEITLQPKELRSHKLFNQSKRMLSGIHEDICEPTNKNSEVRKMIKRHIVDDPGRMSFDEKDVKRLKLREDSHIKLTGNELLNETQRPISQDDMHLQIDDSIRHPSSAQTGPGCHIVGTTTAIVRNGDVCSVLGGHHSSGVDMSSSHNQLNMMFAQLNSAGRISDLQHLAPDMEDASIGQSKLLLESLLGESQINQSDMLNFPRHDFMDIGSLLKLEELKDKELEEAQEVRHRCELAERQALKAYREAQRALIDANERCSLLYRRRELFSAHVRTLVMDGGNSLLSPGWSSRARTQMESAERVGKASHVPSPVQGYNMVGKNCSGSLADVKSGDDAHEAEHRVRHVELASQLLLGHSSKSELLSSPNVDGSDTGYNGALVGRSHPFDSHNMPIRDGRFFLAYSNSNDSRLVCEEENLGGEMVSLNMEAGKISAGQNLQDLELEATLRSKLCARFSKKPSVMDYGRDKAPIDECKGDGSPYIEKETGTQMNGQTHLSNGVSSYEKNGTAQMKGQPKFTDVPSYEKNNILIGVDNLCEIKQSLSMPPDQQISSGCFPEETCEPDHTSVSSVFLYTLATVSRHLNFILPYPIFMHEKHTHTNSSDQFVNVKDVTSYGMRMSRTISTGSYHCDLVVDPLWPLCMFDLRGRCNDQECQWQHLRDCISVEQDIIKHNTSSSDALKGRSVMSASKSSRGLNGSTVFIPTYRIGSNLVKAEKLQFESLLARSNWHYWQMSFSTSFFLPFSIQRPQPSDAPLLQGFGDHADHDNSKRQLLSPLNQDKIMKLIAHGMTDLEQALELAIDLFNTKTNKTVGRRKALSVLSRSLEANPSSTVLWIAYLSIYYRKEKDLGDDDMFLLAVQHNENSYDLWLMYINSRMQFDSRMDAYDEALHALCHKKQTDISKDGYLSACILDLFVQMVDFLCMSGNAEILTPRIYELLDSLKDSESLATMLLIDIISCLVTTDRCIFWICCIYFVLYKKLPEVIIQQIESEKDIPFEMEWPILQLTNGKKHLPMELMRMALDNLDLAPDSMACGDDCSRRTNERSAQFIAVSHVRFVAAIEGSESYVPLLDRYINKYPTCIELIKMSAHFHNLLRCDLGFEYFEQALRDWPGETPGIQCLWNQYAAYALDCKRLDVGEELMVRWFCSFCKYQNLESDKGVESDLSGSVDHIPGSMKNRDCSLSSSDDLPFLALEGDSYNQDDVMFGFLNLFLYHVMQNDKEKACAAIERALKEAPTHYYTHCVREHSSFHLANTVSSDGINSNRVLTLLDGYFGDIRCYPQSRLLSRRYCQYLKKPRLRHLIDSLLGPFSLDCFLLNSILYECYGPSLLPKKLVEPKALVDNVEHLIEILPANYKLAISAYKCAAKVSDHAGVAASGIMFWASTLLVNAVLQSSPVAPVHVWLEAVELLSNLEDHRISERFLQQGLSAYPFSKKLWQSYYRLSKIIGANPSYVVEAARERGVDLTLKSSI